MITRSDVPGPHYQLTFQYDWMGRRIRKTVVNTDTGQTISDLIFLYDGWNLIAEVNAQTGELIRTYVWGLDLSGTMQGAGGIGGLLWVNVESGSHTGRYFAACDGNGNVMGLVSASGGSVVAQYEYGPFAEPLRATGPLAADNPFRFSTKYCDTESGLDYYGRRYYVPSTGRWLSADPVGTAGGKNLYAFVRNSPGLDVLGLFQLHYINQPQWLPKDEYLWVGHYWTFDENNVTAFTATQYPGYPFVSYEAIMLFHHTSRVTVTDCETGVTHSNASRDLYHYQHMALNNMGGVRSIHDNDPFAVGIEDVQTLQPFVETIDAPMPRLFRESPGYNSETSGDGTPSKGVYETTLEVRFLPSESYHAGPAWIPPPRHGLYPTINGHDLKRYYEGCTIGAPNAWMVSPSFVQTIQIRFSWDNCCGRRRWNYSHSPTLTSKGMTRWRYSPLNWANEGPSDFPEAVSLLDQPYSSQ